MIPAVKATHSGTGRILNTPHFCETAISAIETGKTGNMNRGKMLLMAVMARLPFQRDLPNDSLRLGENTSHTIIENNIERKNPKR